MSLRIPISIAVPTGARAPSIVTWGRIEGNPRSTDFERSLRVEVRDALWMLGRQWQVGEFTAVDGGSPTLVRVTSEVEPITSFTDAVGASTTSELDVPLEIRVEREPLPDDVRVAMQIGVHWMRLLRLHVGDDRYRPLFVAAYPLAAPVSNDLRTAQWSAATRARAVDGKKLVEDLRAGLLAASVTANGASVASPDQPLVTLAQHDLLSWFARSFAQPGPEKTWVAEQLEYQFGLATHAASGSSTTLRATEYRGGHLDWCDFDVASRTASTSPAPANSTTTELLATPVTFSGMPSSRWWEVEDQRLDFGAVDAHPTELSKLLLMEFGLIYGNEWSIVPLSVPVGSLSRVTSLVVSDSFGQQTAVPSLHVDGSPWNIFTLSGPAGATAGLFIPPVLATTAEGPAIERVDLVRDEMANMVWAIEVIVPDQIGGGISGRENEPSPAPAPTGSLPHYELMNTVPRSWIPFVPTHVTGSNREIQLQRGAMIGPAGTRVAPRGAILVPAPATPYCIHEEEIPRSGVRITRQWQRARRSDGRTFVWIGRRRTVGRGEGSSGLAFDQVRPR